jgi:hypothetical protein
MKQGLYGYSEHFRAIPVKISLLSRYLAAAVIVLCGCGGGGGGGGGEEFGPASVSIRSEPGEGFIGDRFLITTEVWDINDDGVVLKFRFPDTLRYFHGSSYLRVGDVTYDVGPIANDTAKHLGYLVFVFHGDVFPDHQGTLTLELQAWSGTGKQKIELDPALLDTQVYDQQQFDIKHPLFGTNIDTQIEINAP